MYNEGKATLCVYDDLSKQAAAYRSISLVLRRPPGREAYPGRRVLSPLPPARARREAERRSVGGGRQEHPQGRAARSPRSRSSRRRPATCRRTSRRTSSRSPTARSSSRPICSTPARAPRSTSVSRCRASVARRRSRRCAASPAVCASISRSIASSKPSRRSRRISTRPPRRQLERGARTVEVLKQPQYQPMPVEQQVMIIYAVTNGFLDDIEVSRLRVWEKEFLAFMAHELPAGRPRDPRREGAVEGSRGDAQARDRGVQGDAGWSADAAAPAAQRSSHSHPTQLTHGAGTRAQGTDQVHRRNAQDHADDGDGRHVEAEARAGSRRRRAPVRARARATVIADLYSPELAERFPLLRQPAATSGTPIAAARRGAAAHVESRARRRVQRESHPRSARAARAARRPRASRSSCTSSAARASASSATSARRSPRQRIDIGDRPTAEHALAAGRCARCSDFIERRARRGVRRVREVQLARSPRRRRPSACCR